MQSALVGFILRYVPIPERVVLSQWTPGIVADALRDATSGETEEMRYEGWRVLVNFSLSPQNRGTLASVPNLIKGALNAAGESAATERIKYAAMLLIRNVAVQQENKIPLFNTPGLVDIALDAARSGETNEIKTLGLGLLSNLALAVENKVPLFSTPDLMCVAVDSMESGGTAEIKAAGRQFLRNLAYSPSLQREDKASQEVSVPHEHHPTLRLRRGGGVGGVE
jgi:hypothetical protein